MSQTVPRWTWMLLVTACLLLIITAGVKGCNDQETIPQPQQEVQQRKEIVRFEGLTPCDVNMDFPFLMQTYGDSVSISFPGIPTPVRYTGKGLLRIPKGRTPGFVNIVSLNPRKEARITVKEIQGRL